MTEAELLTDLSTNYNYLCVDPSPRYEPEDGKEITQAGVEVVETGLSEKLKKPIATIKTVSYYVYKKGQVGLEQAFYGSDEPVNEMLKDVTLSGSSYLAIANLYNSQVLQDRLLAAVITQCQVVLEEDPGTTNHANRMKLVAETNTNVLLVVMQFMALVALDATVQSQGTSVTDATLQTIVTNSWNDIADLLVA
jgi:hypothetical protein